MEHQKKNLTQTTKLNARNVVTVKQTSVPAGLTIFPKNLLN